MGPDGTLSTSDLAGILIPAVPAGIPSPVGSVGPVGPVGTLSTSGLESDGPVDLVGRLSPFNPGDRLSSFAPPVGEMSSVDPARGPPGGLIPVIGTMVWLVRILLLHNYLPTGRSGITGMSWIWTLR